MFNSNLAYEFPKSETVQNWSYYVENISKVFRLNEEEKQQLNSSVVAKIIASIPFIAGCNEPERTAIAHLCLYQAELMGFHEYCSHTKEDDADYLNRLSFLSTFEGGNPEVIEHGMNLLALIMIENYKKSFEKDKRNKVYNPFVAGVWNYEKMKMDIKRKIDRHYIPELDDLFYEDPKMIIWV